MESLNELLMGAIFKADIKGVKYCLKKDESGEVVKINGICSNGMTPLGAAAQSGNLTIVKCLLDFHNANTNPAPLDIRNDNHDHSKMQLHLDLASTGKQIPKKKQNIGYFVVCRETEDLGEGPTPDGMEGLEWDMEVDDNASKEPESSHSKPPEVSLYHWYADILSRSAVMLKSPENDLGRLDGFGFGVLHYAAKVDSPALLDYLLSNCSVLDVDQPDQTGLTPLHIAVSFASLDTVIYLISKGANINALTKERETPLHLAARYNQLDIMKLLLERGAKPNATDLRDRNPLALAVAEGHTAAVEILISAGSRLNIEESDGYTPLKRAISRNQADIVCLLLENGARVIHSHFLLHTAAYDKNPHIVQALLRASPTLMNTRNLQGNTPLMVACTQGNISVVTRLLLSGANPNTRNNLSGFTAVHVCVQSLNDTTVFKQLLELLIDYGADLDINSSQGTPLWYAVALKKHFQATLLLQHGASVDIQTERISFDILSLARYRDDDNLVRLLVYAGHSVRDMILPIKKDERYYEFMKNVTKTPMNLRDMCRIKIRKCIGSQKFIWKVQQLPLPSLLHNYLTFHIL